MRSLSCVRRPSTRALRECVGRPPQPTDRLLLAGVWHRQRPRHILRRKVVDDGMRWGLRVAAAHVCPHRSEQVNRCRRSRASKSAKSARTAYTNRSTEKVALPAETQETCDARTSKAGPRPTPTSIPRPSPLSFVFETCGLRFSRRCVSATGDHTAFKHPPVQTFRAVTADQI